MATYSDRFDPEIKRWDKLLFLPDRGLQAAELNELQSVLNYKIRQLGNVFISDGSVITGCEIQTPKDEVYPATLTVSPGLIYIDGSIIHVDESPVEGTFTGDSIEYIYVRSVETIVTANEDSDLKDPAVGIPNYQQVGSDRRVLSVSFSNEDNKSSDSILFGFIRDGEVIFKPSSIGADKIIDVLAERTSDISGNFVVEGADLVLTENDDDSTQYDVRVDIYNIFLRGRQYKSQVPQVITINKAIQTTEDQDFIQVGNNIGDEAPLTKNVFRLESLFIDHVDYCIYPVRKTFTVTFGGSGGQDKIMNNPDGSIVSVVSVTQGITTFQATTDYLVDITEWEIDWSPGGAEPNPVGSTYNVDVIYLREFNLGAGAYDNSRYIVEYPDESNDNYAFANLIIKDSEYYNSNDALIVNPEYTAFSYRTDAITVDEDGLVSYVSGKYSRKSPPPAPVVSNREMVLYTIEVTPGDYNDPALYQYEDRRIFNLTQERLNVMGNAVQKIRDNQVFSQLDQDASSMPVTGVMGGIFTDSFQTEDRADVGYIGNYAEFPNAYDSARDGGALSLPILVNSSVLDPTIASNECRENLSCYTLPFIEKVMLDQSLATNWISINPYSIPYVEPILNISPRRDVWVDHQTIDVVKPGETINYVTRSVRKITTIWRHFWNSGTWSGIFLGQEQSTQVSTASSKRFRWPNGILSRSRQTNSRLTVPFRDDQANSISTERRLIDVETENQTIRYARTRVITLEGENWLVAGDTNDYVVKVSMNKKEIATTAVLQSDYTFSGTFTIPATTIPTGEIPVNVWLEHISNPGITVLQAGTTYYSKGTLQITRRIHETIKTLTRSVVTYERRVRWRDPLAQSFNFDRDFFLTSVGGFFRLKDASERVVCEVFEMENGYPSQRKLGDASLTPDLVSTSTDSSAESRFYFLDPIYIPKNTEFAVVFRSASDIYQMYYAKQGENDLLTGDFVVAQPYQGVMFKSQNGSTWTAIQDSDMKIKLYRAEFQLGTSEIVFNTQTAIDSSWLLMNAEIHEFDDTTVAAFYNIGSGYEEMELGREVQLVEIGQSVPSQNQVKLQVSTTNVYVSPVIAKEIGTLYWKYDNIGYYYSDTIDFGEDNQFDHVKVRIYGFPNTYTFSLEMIASDDGVAWTKFIPSETSRVATSIQNIDENLDVQTYLYEWVFDLTWNVGGDGKGFPDNGNILNPLAQHAKFMIKLNGDYVDTPLLFDFRVVVYEGI